MERSREIKVKKCKKKAKVWRKSRKWRDSEAEKWVL